MKTLTCENAEKLLIRDLDEGLNPADHARLEDHLVGCSACCELREQFRDLLVAVKADVPEDPGEHYWRMYDVSLDAKLREEEMRPRTVFGWRVVGAFAAAGVIILAAALGVIDFKKPGTMDPVVSAAVMEDLTELYGPIPEGDSLFIGRGVPVETFSLVASDGMTYDDVETTWFEVEDDRNHLFL